MKRNTGGRETHEKNLRWTASAFATNAPTVQCLFKRWGFCICAQLKQSRLSQRTALKIGARLFLGPWVAGLFSLALAFLSRSERSNTLSSDLFNLLLAIRFSADARCRTLRWNTAIGRHSGCCRPNGDWRCCYLVYVIYSSSPRGINAQIITF